MLTLSAPQTNFRVPLKPDWIDELGDDQMNQLIYNIYSSDFHPAVLHLLHRQDWAQIWDGLDERLAAFMLFFVQTSQQVKGKDVTGTSQSSVVEKDGE